MTDIDLLPLPEKEQLANPYAHSFGSVAAYGHTDDTLRDYARACVAHATAPLQAENERLRAERESLWGELENWKECFCQAASGAERLAKLLRELSEVCRAAIKAGDWKVDGACDPDSLLSRADAAIDEAMEKENKA